MSTKMKTITERLHESMPELQEHKRISEVLRPYKRSTSYASTTHLEKAQNEVKDRILELLTNGEEVPDDVARPILEAKERDELFDLRANTLSHLAREVLNSQQSIMATSTEDTTAFLRMELRRVVSEVRKLTPHLKGITTAEEAIGAGQSAIDAWQQATKSVQEYDELRNLQFTLARSSSDGLTKELFLRTGILADAIDIQGFWLDRRRQSAHAEERGGHTSSGSRGADYKKWLLAARPTRTFEYTNDWWDTGESKIAHLMRLVSTATPWLPSPDELREALNLAVSATGQVTTDLPDQMETARRGYYTLTGARPKVKLPEPPQFVRDAAPYKQPAKLTKRIQAAQDRQLSENERGNQHAILAAGRD